MMVFVKNIKVVPGLPGWLLIDFDDKQRKLVNINPHMEGVLEKLKDQSFFDKVFIDQELQTVSWPGELDLDPDNLHYEGIEVEFLKDIIQAAKGKGEFSNFIKEEIAY